jgi:glycerol kinase
LIDTQINVNIAAEAVLAGNQPEERRIAKRTNRLRQPQCRSIRLSIRQDHENEREYKAAHLVMIVPAKPLDTLLSMKYILALDQGTTSSRAVLLGPDGRVHGSAQTSFRQIFPKPGWVEHDPVEIWSSQFGVAMEALAQANAAANSIAAIGITNQRETTIIWDRKTDEPVYNAIVWQDRRTSGFCDRLRENGYEPLIQQKTGLVIDAYFSASKIRWLLDNVPGVKERAVRGELAFGTVDSWLIWKLTGGTRHVTDVTNASRTMLFNLRSLEWDDELLTLLEIPRSLLPEVVGSSEICATSSGVLHSVPIAGIAGDQQAALFGQMCMQPGMVKCTYGTGSFMLLNTGEKPIVSRNRLVTTIAWRMNGKTTYALEGSVFIAGAVVQWLRDELQLIRSAPEIEDLAASVPDTAGVYVVPAFSGLGAPHWDQYARGTIIGLTRGANRAHIARAALEGIAFQIADIVSAMEDDSGVAVKELRVDGGASRNNLLMQIQADVLGCPVTRPANPETTVLGATYLAGLAVGYWPHEDTIAKQWAVDRRFSPNMRAGERESKRAGWKRALERARNWETS